MAPVRLGLRAVILLIALACGSAVRADLPTTGPAPASLSVAVESVQTCDGLGRCQGASEHDGSLWLYGDAQPNGVIRQYAVDHDAAGEPHVRYTGLQIDLTLHGVNLINHPTGLTWNPEFGCYLGNTITKTKTGTIYHLDWPRMLIDRNLDHAVLGETNDDLAVQGCRPEFVRHGDRWLLATADYGHVRNAVRLYDPERLATALHTSDPGVAVTAFPCGPWGPAAALGRQPRVAAGDREPGRGAPLAVGAGRPVVHARPADDPAVRRPAPAGRTGGVQPARPHALRAGDEQPDGQRDDRPDHAAGDAGGCPWRCRRPMNAAAGRYARSTAAAIAYGTASPTPCFSDRAKCVTPRATTT